MREPGAWVVGHRAAVRGSRSGVQASCSCGRVLPEGLTVPGACLTLVQHLQAAVRDGAAVSSGEDDDGSAGVREPRRPLPPAGGGRVELDLA